MAKIVGRKASSRWSAPARNHPAPGPKAFSALEELYRYERRWVSSCHPLPQHITKMLTVGPPNVAAASVVALAAISSVSSENSKARMSSAPVMSFLILRHPFMVDDSQRSAAGNARLSLTRHVSVAALRSGYALFIIEAMG